MDLFRSHTQRAVEGSGLPCPSCVSGVLIQAILFIADQGVAGTEGGSSAERLRVGSDPPLSE